MFNTILFLKMPYSEMFSQFIIGHRFIIEHRCSMKRGNLEEAPCEGNVQQ